MNGKKGFTLAEILVTLGVVGVIASMTVPAVVQDIQDAQLKIKWKKAYSTASQLGRYLSSEYGGSLKGVCGNSTCWKNATKKYFNAIKECEPGTTQGNCWATGYMRYLNGSLDTTWDTPAFFNNSPAIVTADGVSIAFEILSSDCTYTSYGECFRLNIDVNGMQKPNTYGKDIFFARVYNGDNAIKVAPMLGDCTTNGVGCSAKYLYQ